MAISPVVEREVLYRLRLHPLCPSPETALRLPADKCGYTALSLESDRAGLSAERRCLNLRPGRRPELPCIHTARVCEIRKCISRSANRLARISEERFIHGERRTRPRSTLRRTKMIASPGLAQSWRPGGYYSICGRKCLGLRTSSLQPMVPEAPRRALITIRVYLQKLRVSQHKHSGG